MKEYEDVENGVRSLIEQTLDEIRDSCPQGYIQLLAGADYEPLHEWKFRLKVTRVNFYQG